MQLDRRHRHEALTSGGGGERGPDHDYDDDRGDDVSTLENGYNGSSKRSQQQQPHSSGYRSSNSANSGRPARFGDARARKQETHRREKPSSSVKKLDSLKVLREKQENHSGSGGSAGDNVSETSNSSEKLTNGQYKKDKAKADDPPPQAVDGSRDRNKPHIIQEGRNKFRVDYSYGRKESQRSSHKATSKSDKPTSAASKQEKTTTVKTDKLEDQKGL